MRAVLVACVVLVGLPLASVASCAKGGDTTGFHQVGGSETSTTMQGGASSTTPTTTRGNTSTEMGTGGTTTTTTDTGGGGGGTGGNCDHVGNATCATAVDISMGEFDGDETGNTRIEHGEASAWYRLTITEGSDADRDISYTAKLQNPPGMNYELLVYGYKGGKDDTAQCTDDSEEATGSPDPTISECWGDSFVVSTDNRNRLFEVRYISGGACGPDAQWTLTFTGYTQGSTCP